MVQQVKALASKPNNQSSIFGTHTIKVENCLVKVDHVWNDLICNCWKIHLFKESKYQGWASTLAEKAIDSWRLLRQRKSIVFRSVLPGKLTMLHGRPHIHDMGYGTLEVITTTMTKKNRKLGRD